MMPGAGDARTKYGGHHGPAQTAERLRCGCTASPMPGRPVAPPRVPEA
jgi:hypothetical protein